MILLSIENVVDLHPLDDRLVLRQRCLGWTSLQKIKKRLVLFAWQIFEDMQ
jgi:hypothetical protein